MSSLTFLESISGYAQQMAREGSAGRPNRLATVDPAYTYGDSTARVTFDGESTMSTKPYPILGNNYPLPSQRVLLVPVGTTYLIVGSLPGLFRPNLTTTSSNATGVTSGSQTTDWITSPTLSFNGTQQIKISITWNAASASSSPSIANVIIREDTTDIDSMRVGLPTNSATDGGTYFTVHTPSQGDHVYKFRIQWASGGTITFAAAASAKAKLLVEPFG